MAPPELVVPGPATLSGVSQFSGPLFLGYLFSFTLFGVLCLQVFLYYIAFPRDPRWLKAFVYLVFMIELVLNTLFAAAGWAVFGSGFGNTSHLLAFATPANVPQPALMGLAESLFHSFYCWRIYRITQNVVLPLVIGAISATQFATAIYISVFYGRATEMQSVHDINAIVAVWHLGAAVADVIITVALVSIFMKHRRASNFPPTVNKLEGLIKFTVETGLVTTMTAIAQVVLWFASPNTFWWTLIFPCLAKVYSNTLLASLNSRIILKNGNDSSTTCPDDGSLHCAMWSDQSTASSQTADIGSIHIITNTEIDREDTEMHVRSRRASVQKKNTV